MVFALLVLETLYEIPELGIHVYLLPAEELKACEEQVAKAKGKDQKEKLIPAESEVPSYGTK